jgi:hypothetical protein
MDPSRLLATRAGLERELLRSALTDVAPDEVRARVLQSVSAVLATSAAAGASAAAAAGANTAAAAGGTTGAGAISGAGGKLWGLASGGSRVLRAVALGALLGAGVSVAVVLHHPTEGTLSPQGVLPDALQAPRRESAPDAPVTEPASVPEARSDRSGPGALANTGNNYTRRDTRSDTRSNASGIEYLTDRNRTPEEAEASSRSEGAGTDLDELPPDWLGAQLQLLRDARAHLESGDLARAAELLDSYEQQFPGGVIGPQVVRLRAELWQQRSGHSLSP